MIFQEELVNAYRAGKCFAGLVLAHKENCAWGEPFDLNSFISARDLAGWNISMQRSHTIGIWEKLPQEAKEILGLPTSDEYYDIWLHTFEKAYNAWREQNPNVKTR